VEPLWRLTLLGELCARREDRVVTRFRTRKAGTLLAYLAYHRQRRHPRLELIDLLWPERAPEAGRDNLSTALSWLRRLLEPPGVPAGSVLVADRVSVGLNHPTAVTTDVAEFKAALRAAQRATEPGERVESLSGVVERYTGPLLPGSDDEWVVQERLWLAESYFQALGQLLAHLESIGEFERAIHLAQRGVSADPLREEAHRDLIRLYAAVGQTTAALRQYEELQRLLKVGLGSAPGAATRALVREVERLAVLRPAAPVTLHPSNPERASPGSRLSGGSRAEIRLVTALAVRIHGAGCGRASARANRLAMGMMDALLKYEGRIESFAADCVLGLFGVPRAHEDDPERAIRAALEIRTAAEKQGLVVTAGIDTGEVSLDAAASAPRQSTGSENGGEAVTGAVLDRVIRLRDTAGPGQILVGEAAHGRTRRAFAFSSATAGPAVAHEVIEPLLRPQKAYGIDGMRAELTGREEELARIRQAVTAFLKSAGAHEADPGEIQSGESARGQMVAIIGEAGVGKSRLVAELKAGLTSPPDPLPGAGRGNVPAAVDSSSNSPPRSVGRAPAPATGPREWEGLGERLTPLWLEGRCLELGMTTSYSLLLDLFRDYFHWRPDEEDRVRGGRLREALRDLVTHGELAEERSEEMGPLLGRMLAIHDGDDWDPRLAHAGPEQVRRQTLMAVREFLLALARRRPVVLVLEDLHWSDTHSLDLISLLIDALPESSLCLLCVYRPEREHRSWRLGSGAAQKCAGHYTELVLRELSPAQSRRLMHSLLRAESLSPAVEAFVLERARGNPFYLEEMIRALIDTGRLYRSAAMWQMRQESLPTSVPESLQSLILSRVDRLRPELKQLLQRAAVIGRLFERRLLEEVADASPTIEGALWELEEQGLIYQERAVPEEEYSFKHVLTRDAVYHGIPMGHRALHHQQIAETIERCDRDGLDARYEALAYHYERSEAHEKAIEYLLKAGEKARRAYANDAAIGYFQRAVDRIERGQSRDCSSSLQREQRRLQALTGLGKLHHTVGNQDKAAGFLQKAIAIARAIGATPRELVRLFYWLSEVVWWQGHPAELIQIGTEGLAVLGEDTESVEAALMYAAIGEGYVHSHDDEKWREFTLRAASCLERLPYSEELRPAYLHIIDVYLYLDRDTEEAARWSHLLEERARQQQDWIGLAAAYDCLGDLLAVRGELRQSLPLYERCLETARKTGQPLGESLAHNGLATRLLSLGEIAAAAESASRGLQTAQSVEDPHTRAELHLVSGRIALCQNRWIEAMESLHESRQLCRDDDRHGQCAAALSLGDAYLAQGDRHAAKREYESALSVGATDSAWLAEVLSRLESIHNDPAAFAGFCRCLRQESPELNRSPLSQWHLEPAELRLFPHAGRSTEFPAPPSEWVWHDPLGAGACRIANGCELHAANGQDLWCLNRSAPRLLRPISGEFAVQTVSHPVSSEKPCIGGVLIWQDAQNYLRLDRGAGGPAELSFVGCVANQDRVFGRGRLAVASIALRLERAGRRVRALCSADGRDWFQVGEAELSFTDPVQVGVFAIGAIDRTIYRGGYPEGSAIRFERFLVWT
jgi:predicted ATPase